MPITENSLATRMVVWCNWSRRIFEMRAAKGTPDFLLSFFDVVLSFQYESPIGRFGWKEQNIMWGRAGRGARS